LYQNLITILIRLKSFFDPSSGNNYHPEQASQAIINGGIFGKGIGERVLKNIIPKPHSDYIVSVDSQKIQNVNYIFLMKNF
jgi:Bacterial cell division membrane protein